MRQTWTGAAVVLSTLTTLWLLTTVGGSLLSSWLGSSALAGASMGFLAGLVSGGWCATWVESLLFKPRAGPIGEALRAAVLTAGVALPVVLAATLVESWIPPEQVGWLAVPTPVAVVGTALLATYGGFLAFRHNHAGAGVIEQASEVPAASHTAEPVGAVSPAKALRPSREDPAG